MTTLAVHHAADDNWLHIQQGNDSQAMHHCPKDRGNMDPIPFPNPDPVLGLPQSSGLQQQALEGLFPVSRVSLLPGSGGEVHYISFPF